MCMYKYDMINPIIYNYNLPIKIKLNILLYESGEYYYELNMKTQCFYIERSLLDVFHSWPCFSTS